MPLDSEAAPIEAQLKRILRSQGFDNAPRVKEFLDFVVKKKLAGNEKHLKETLIGVELFKRPGYDPAKDTIVRVTASRVREKLYTYYKTEGSTDLWRITLPNDGYIPQIETKPEAMAEPVAEPGKVSAPTAGNAPPAPNERFGMSRSARWRAGIFIAAMILLALGLSMPRESFDPLPGVIPYTQITHDGQVKAGPLLIHGGSVYFTEFENGATIPVSVPAAGGATAPLDLAPVRDPRFQDARNDGSEFLVTGENSSGVSYLWRWAPGRPPRPLIPSAGAAGWISDSVFTDTDDQQMCGAYHCSSILRIFDRDRPDTSPGRVPVPMPVAPNDTLRWSDSGNTLRFTVLNPSKGGSSIWEMRGLHGRPEPLSGYPADSRNGTWSADGRLFVFLAKGQAGYDGHDIWVADERNGQKPARPFRLTSGPLDFQWAASSPDGRRVYAIGSLERGELVRYDTRAKQFLPYLSGVSGLETDFSRDGRWVAYATYPERTLWKIKPDGSRPVQLTFPPLNVAQPHWSPDGARLAFMGWYPGQPCRIYIVSSEGGSPSPVIESGGEQGVPTWSPDGGRLIYGDLQRGKPGREMAIHILDLNRHRVSTLPGSQGIFNPRWSPDGRYVLGLTPDYAKLLLFDFEAGVWHPLATLSQLENPMWASDSVHIYFSGLGPANALARPIDDPSKVPDLAIYRLNIHRKTVERVAGLNDFSWPRFRWIGVEPNGSPLALRAVGIQELYMLTLRQ